MLQKWKKDGETSRDVEKPEEKRERKQKKRREAGHERRKQRSMEKSLKKSLKKSSAKGSMKSQVKNPETLQAAKFRDLPVSLKLLIVNVSLFLILWAVFFMAGAYLYAPQAAGRSYLEACLAGDWNSAYDVCKFPDSTFLSRKNYVNAMTWKAEQDGSAKEATPEIKSFFMRRKESQETGKNRIYTVRYTLKGVSDAQEEKLEIASGKKVSGNFKEWYVVPKDSYVTNVDITVPKNASFYLDGVLIGKKYVEETGNDTCVYRIPYLFVGGHTIELTEKQKDPYREIILVEDNSSLEFLPDLKLNDSTGKVIADRVEEVLDTVLNQASQGESFQKIKQEFSSDQTVQSDAKEQYQELCDAWLDETVNTGITSVTVSSVSTTVVNVSNQMQIETTVTASVGHRNRFFYFFRKNTTENVTWTLKSVVTLEDEKWVMGSDFLKGIETGKQTKKSSKNTEK